MPTKSAEFKNGTLYFGYPETGEKLGDINIVSGAISVEPESENIGEPIQLGGEYTFTCDCEIDRNVALSLVYGRRVTNNWLKMHGGVMSRKGARRRKHRRNISR